MQAKPKDISDLHRLDGRDNVVADIKNRIVPILPAEPKTSTADQPESWGDSIQKALVTSSELESLDLPPREPLLGDWLCAADLGIIYAYR